MRSRDVIQFLGFPDCSSGFLQKVLCEIVQGNIGKIKDLIDVLSSSSLSGFLSRNLYRINLRELCNVVYLLLGVCS